MKINDIIGYLQTLNVWRNYLLSVGDKDKDIAIPLCAYIHNAVGFLEF